MNLFKTLIIALVVSAAGFLAACNTVTAQRAAAASEHRSTVPITLFR